MHKLLGIWLAGSLAIQAADLALVGARIYPAPDALPIKSCTPGVAEKRPVFQTPCDDMFDRVE